MGGFVPQGPGVTPEDRIFEEPDVSHGKHLLDRVSTEPHLLSHVDRTMRRRRRVGNLHVHEASPQLPDPDAPGRARGSRIPLTLSVTTPSAWGAAARGPGTLIGSRLFYASRRRGY